MSGHRSENPARSSKIEVIAEPRGFVTHTLPVGCACCVTIRELTRQEIQNAYQMRRLIELGALKAYVPSVDLDDVASLKTETARLMNAQPESFEEKLRYFKSGLIGSQTAPRHRWRAK